MKGWGGCISWSQAELMARTTRQVCGQKRHPLHGRAPTGEEVTLLEATVWPSQEFLSSSFQGVDSSEPAGASREITASGWIVRAITGATADRRLWHSTVNRFLTHIHFVKRCFSKLSLYWEDMYLTLVGTGDISACKVRASRAPVLYHRSVSRSQAPCFVFIFHVPDKLSGPSARFLWIIRRLQEADVLKLSMTSP